MKFATRQGLFCSIEGSVSFHLRGEIRGLDVLKSDAGGLERLCSCGLEEIHLLLSIFHHSKNHFAIRTTYSLKNCPYHCPPNHIQFGQSFLTKINSENVIVLLETN